MATAWNAITSQSNCRLQMAHTNWQKVMEDPRWRSGKENLDKEPVVAVKCTICDQEIPSNTPFSKGEGPRKYYFCSAAHLDKFENDPASYRDERKPPTGEDHESRGHR